MCDDIDDHKCKNDQPDGQVAYFFDSWFTEVLIDDVRGYKNHWPKYDTGTQIEIQNKFPKKRNLCRVHANGFFCRKYFDTY